MEQPLPAPPAISTLPLGSSVAVAKARAVFITGVDGREGVGSRVVQLRAAKKTAAAAISTLPLGSSVAVALLRAVFIAGVYGREGVSDWVI